jgi:hypothetical protein
VEADIEEEYYEELREQRLKARADAEAEYERRVSGYREGTCESESDTE